MHHSMCAVIQNREGIRSGSESISAPCKALQWKPEVWQSCAIFILVRVCTRCMTCKLNWQQNTASRQRRQLRSEVILKYLVVLQRIDLKWERLCGCPRSSINLHKKCWGGLKFQPHLSNIASGSQKINKSKIRPLFHKNLHDYSHVTNNFCKHCP